MFFWLANIFLLLISGLNLVWSENTLCMTFILSSFLKIVLYTSRWPILLNVLCFLESNVYTLFLMGGVFYKCQLAQVC